jgi:hypothetical protein
MQDLGSRSRRGKSNSLTGHNLQQCRARLCGTDWPLGLVVDLYQDTLQQPRATSLDINYESATHFEKPPILGGPGRNVLHRTNIRAQFGVPDPSRRARMEAQKWTTGLDPLCFLARRVCCGAAERRVRAGGTGAHARPVRQWSRTIDEGVLGVSSRATLRSAAHASHRRSTRWRVR